LFYGAVCVYCTQSHVVDPKNPGAVDEIIHLGDFWDEEGIRKHKREIMDDNREVGRTFRRAYRYIKGAYSFYEDNMEIISWGIDNAEVNSIAKELTDIIFGDTDTAKKEGRIRRLFASAITPNGYVNYLSTLLEGNKVYMLEGRPGTGTEKVISKVMETAVVKGYDVEAYYCALNPLKLEHLVIPKLGVALATSNEYHNITKKDIVPINLDEYIDEKILDKYKSELEFNKGQFDSIMDSAIKTIAKAKEIHDRMETYYISNMDFEAIKTCFEITLSRVLQYAEESKF